MPGVDRVRFLRSPSGSSLIQLFLKHREHVSVAALLLCSSCWLLSCSGNAAPATSSPSQRLSSSAQQAPLTSLRWCGKPLLLFRDEGTVMLPEQEAGAAQSPVSTPTPITIQNWSQVEPHLGFRVFLPALLPAGSCLVSVYGTLHDPILGSSFTIAYLLPDHTSLSLSEAPLRSSHVGFQCSLAQAHAPSASTSLASADARQEMRLCSGIRDTTNIVFSAPWSDAALRTFFLSLRTDGSWLPVAQ
jgi:hypothetical protein